MVARLPAVVIDIVDGARAQVENNEIVELSRVAILDYSALTRPFILDEIIIDAVTTRLLPATGLPHILTPNLYLKSKVAMPEAGQSRIVRVELAYSRIDEFGQPPGATWAVRVNSSSVAIESTVDRSGVPITVAWTPPGATVADVQGGVIHPEVASMSITASHSAQSTSPTMMPLVWTNAVNTGGFAFDPTAQPRSWRVVNVAVELVDPESLPFPTWRFAYTIVKVPITVQGAAGGHDPMVFYKDDNGDPPEGLVAGVGYKTIEWYTAMSFASLFG